MSDAAEERGHMVPSSSTMALSFAEVKERLPAGVSLEKEAGLTRLTHWIKGVGPAVALPMGAGVAVFYGAAYGVPLSSGVIALMFAVAGVLSFGYAFGRRRVTIDGRALRVRSLPIPLPGDGAVEVDESARIEVVTVGIKSGALSYRIDVLHSRGRRSIMQDIPSEETALVLARYLANELQLPLPERALRPA